jgi:hypothetical protein
MKLSADVGPRIRDFSKLTREQLDGLAEARVTPFFLRTLL